MYSKYREQDLKTHPYSLERVADYRGFSLERFTVAVLIVLYAKLVTVDSCLLISF